MERGGYATESYLCQDAQEVICFNRKWRGKMFMSGSDLCDRGMRKEKGSGVGHNEDSWKGNETEEKGDLRDRGIRRKGERWNDVKGSPMGNMQISFHYFISMSPFEVAFSIVFTFCALFLCWHSDVLSKRADVLLWNYFFWCIYVLCTALSIVKKNYWKTEYLSVKTIDWILRSYLQWGSRTVAITVLVIFVCF